MMSTIDKKQLIIVDDHPIMQQGLAMILESEMEFNVLQSFSSAEDLLSEITCLSPAPDLVIIDISLPGMSGLELVKHLSAVYPDLKMLVLSRHDELLYANRVLKAGADGYLMKVEAGKQIVKVIRKILNGNIYVSHKVNEQMLRGMANGMKANKHSSIEQLSDRELEVFEKIGKGCSSRLIAQNLHISVKTVESYRNRIKIKLNIDNAANLMRHAVKWVEQ